MPKTISEIRSASAAPSPPIPGKSFKPNCGICFGNGYQNYCVDDNQNGCCDCGNDGDANWQECEQEAILSLCDSEVMENHIPIYTGCSYQYAENFYCNQADNEGCETFGANVFPSCNFIDDGSCMIYGCGDEDANNTETCTDIGGDPIDCNGTIECEDGSLNNCCEYIEPIQLSFGNINLENGIAEILISIPEYEDVLDYIYGFQFNINGMTLTGASGGLAEEAGFTTSVGGNTVIGFSFSGGYIGQNEGILINLNFSSNSNTACIELGTGGFSNGYTPPSLIPVSIGDCYEF